MYLIDNKIIFFHFPKTSGTYIRINTKNILIPPMIRHIGINHLPDEYYKYPIFGMIRNPFSFYVSFYNYFRNNKIINSPTKEILFCKYFTEDQNIDLDDFQEVKKDFNKHLKLLLTKGDEHKIQIQNYNCGLISRLYQFLYIKNNTDITPEITIIKMEEYDKLNILLSKYNINLIKSTSKINSSKEVDYKLYYTTETIKLVESYDNKILQKYNYHF
tara:strand:+ start:97 stop:744 length:648 start_codon:yes stop_codon:yes gene_type:complete